MYFQVLYLQNFLTLRLLHHHLYMNHFNRNINCKDLHLLFEILNYQMTKVCFIFFTINSIKTQSYLLAHKVIRSNKLMPFLEIEKN